MQFRLIALAISILGLSGCEKKVVTVTWKKQPVFIRQVAKSPPPKMQTMVCRNSQTGAAAECGTPNAVMVGMKDK